MSCPSRTRTVGKSCWEDHTAGTATETAVPDLPALVLGDRVAARQMRAHTERVRAVGVEIAPKGHGLARTAAYAATYAGEEAEVEVEGDHAHAPKPGGKQEQLAGMAPEKLSSPARKAWQARTAQEREEFVEWVKRFHHSALRSPLPLPLASRAVRAWRGDDAFSGPPCFSSGPLGLPLPQV